MLVYTWLLFPLILVLAAVGLELGFRAGRRRREALGSGVQGQLFTVQAAVLGLLGLILAFSFSLSSIRFDTRRALVLEEANAVGTAYLRTQALDEERGERLRATLKRYVDMRVAWAVTADPRRLPEVLARSEAAHEVLWNEASDAAREAPGSLPIALLLESLNEVIDVHEKRVVAGFAHVPAAVLVMVVAAAVLAVSMVGYGFGIAGRRELPSAGVLGLLVAATIVTVIDLDQPHRGLIRVPMQPLKDLQRSQRADPSASALPEKRPQQAHDLDEREVLQEVDEHRERGEPD